MPGLMAEEEHRPQGSDTAAGDGEPDEGSCVVGVHHADLLALEKALVPGVFLLLAFKLHGAFPRLVLLRFRLLLRFQAFLNDAGGL